MRIWHPIGNSTANLKGVGKRHDRGKPGRQVGEDLAGDILSTVQYRTVTVCVLHSNQDIACSNDGVLCRPGGIVAWRTR